MFQAELPRGPGKNLSEFPSGDSCPPQRPDEKKKREKNGEKTPSSKIIGGYVCRVNIKDNIPGNDKIYISNCGDIMYYGKSDEVKQYYWRSLFNVNLLTLSIGSCMYRHIHVRLYK